MNPEETDQFRTFESRVEKLVKGPKKEADDLEKEDSVDAKEKKRPTRTSVEPPES